MHMKCVGHVKSLMDKFIPHISIIAGVLSEVCSGILNNMSTYDYIALVYNPQSTHDAASAAKALARELESVHPHLVETKHAGHAAEIAHDVSLKYKHPLIVSISGDGGYNEVVNGAMKAKRASPSSDPTVAVLAAGNANDHRNALETNDGSFAQKVLRGKPKGIDLLLLSYGNKRQYAHSYIGFGISAEAGDEMNKSKKGGLNDILTVANTIYSDNPVRIIRRGISHTYDSLIFFNIPRMAKMPMLAGKASVHDGKFNLHRISHRPLLARLGALLHLALPLRVRTSAYRTCHFTTLARERVQYDGETMTVAAGKKVTIMCVSDAIKTIY